MWTILLRIKSISCNIITLFFTSRYRYFECYLFSSIDVKTVSRFCNDLQTPSKALQGLDIHGASSLNLVYKFLLLETWNEGPVRVWLDSVLSTSWTHLVVESTQTSWRLHRYIVNNQIISYINDNVNNALTVFVNVFTIQLFVCCT